MAIHDRPIPSRPFGEVPATAAGHFVLCLYAAIFRLLNHVRRMSELAGGSLDRVFERYPFLFRYFEQLRGQMPGDLTWGEAADWWRRELARWEGGVAGRLPLRDLVTEGGVGRRGRLAFMVVGLAEEDSRFGTLFAELQEPLSYRRPTLELVGQMMGESGDPTGAGAWEICQPLIDGGFLETPNPEAPRAEWALRVPPVLWDAARGQRRGLAAGWCRVRRPEDSPSLDELLYPAEILERLRRLPQLLQRPGEPRDAEKARTVVVRGPAGGDPAELVGAVARAMDRGLTVVRGGAEGDAAAPALLGPLCTLTRTMPLLTYDLAPGESARPPATPGYRGATAVALGFEGGLAAADGERAVTVSVPVPDRELRRALWRRAFDGHRVDDLEAIAGRYRLAGGYIRRTASIARSQAALDGRDVIAPIDVQAASRTLNRQLLDTLATPLEATGSWGELVCRPNTSDKLLELERRCRHRERLLDRLGGSLRGNANQGVRALFTGASGTGKTYAARILAREIGMDLYRVDLAAVVNKYIGETEKNLHRVLTRAESLDVLLLLDEGDSLLSSRTEVRSSNDRYANLETNYLLQRLETYEGVVVVTTNLGENIDSAFQRRMDVVVPFFRPSPEERWRILELHLPADQVVDPEFLERVALSCQLTGGQLRNAALHASLLALDDGEAPVDRRHLEEAIASEYRKAGAAYPLTGAGIGPVHGGVEAFVASLEEN